MTKAKLEEALNKQAAEIDALQVRLKMAMAQLEMYNWHKQTNDRFLDILGACSREGTLRIDRTTRQHQEDIKR